jgi:hypothetical protein
MMTIELTIEFFDGRISDDEQELSDVLRFFEGRPEGRKEGRCGAGR